MTKAARLTLVIGLLIAAGTLPVAAGAESLLNKNFHYFQPPADGSGLVLTYGSESLRWLGMHYGVYLDESIDHLTIVLTDGDEESLIRNELGANLLYAIGISRFVNVGFAFPFVIYREFNEDYRPADAHQTSLSDLRVDAKGILWDRRRHCLGLAANLTMTVPLDRGDNTFLSDDGLGFVPRIIVDLGRQEWTAAFNLGYRFGPDSKSALLDNEVDDEILLNTGGAYRFLRSHQAMLEAQFRTSATRFFAEEAANYGEIMAAYRYQLGSYSYWALTAGAAVGVLNGAGTPTVRFFLGVTSYENRLVLPR